MAGTPIANRELSHIHLSWPYVMLRRGSKSIVRHEFDDEIDGDFQTAIWPSSSWSRVRFFSSRFERPRTTPLHSAHDDGGLFCTFLSPFVAQLNRRFKISERRTNCEKNCRRFQVLLSGSSACPTCWMHTLSRGISTKLLVR
jgi:hypothetical protein